MIAGVGDLTINGDGSYSFIPVLNYNGPVPVATYTIDDGNGGSDTATLTIAIGGVNDNPVADDDVFTTAEDVTSGSIALLPGDVDVDGDVLSIASINGTVLTPGTAQVIGVVNGSVNVSAGGVVSFSPAANYHGAVSFDYVVSDGNGGSDAGTVTGTVTSVNDNPVGVDDSGSGTEDTTLSVGSGSGLLSNDSDVDGDVLSISGYTIAGMGGSFGAGSTTTIAGVGDLTINGDGSYSFIPVLNYNGPVPVATYTIDDGNGGSDTATLTIAIGGVNDNPVADDDVFTTAEDVTSGSIALLPGDVDVDGDVLSIASINGTVLTPGTAQVIGVVNGSVNVSAGGVVSFSPAANYHGAVSFDYVVSDGNGGSDTGTVTGTVTSVNDNPVGVDDSGSGTEDTTLSVGSGSGLLSNDSDVDGDVLSISGYTIAGMGGSFGAGSTTTIAGVGDLTINGDGSYSFIPVLNYNGPVPVATYAIDDGNGGSDTATLTIAIGGVNDNPVGVDDSGSGTEDTTLSVGSGSGLLSNDSDVDGDVLSISGYTIAGMGGSFGAGSTTTIAGVGDLTINGDGSYSFIPVLNYNGPVPVATYTIDDGNGGSDTATLTIAIGGVNDNPVADDDVFTTAEDVTSGSIALLPGDVDVDGDVLSIASINGTVLTPGTAQVIGVVNGSVNVSAGGVVSFSPAANYHGAVSFDYVVSDGNGGSDTGTVTGTVTSVNDNPVGVDDSGSGTEDTTLSVGSGSGLLSNDSDVDGDVLSISGYTIAGMGGSFGAGSTTTIAGVGDLTINGDGSYSFIPVLNYNGPVPVATYTIDDGNGGSDTATLTIAIGGVNDNPVADDDVFTTAEDVTSGSIALLPGDVDVDGDVLSIASINGTVLTPGTAQVIGVVNGSVNVSAGGVVSFSPAANYHGAVSFDYVVSDGNGGSDTGTVTGTVTSVNDNPVADDDVFTTAEDVTSGSIALLPGDVDVDGDVLSIASINGTVLTPGTVPTLYPCFEL